MSRFKIPTIFLPGFEILSKLSFPNSEKIAQLFANANVGDSESSLAEIINQDLKLGFEESLQITSSVFSIINLKIDRETNSEQLAEELVKSYEESKGDLLENEHNDLVKKLITFLNADGIIKLTIKANYLSSEYQKVISDSRIITDIRLIYKDNVYDGADNALVIHQLRLSFYENGMEKYFFAAMDSNDLQNLQEDITRSIEKEKQIRANRYTNENLGFI